MRRLRLMMLMLVSAEVLLVKGSKTLSATVLNIWNMRNKAFWMRSIVDIRIVALLWSIARHAWRIPPQLLISSWGPNLYYLLDHCVVLPERLRFVVACLFSGAIATVHVSSAVYKSRIKKMIEYPSKAYDGEGEVRLETQNIQTSSASLP